MATDAMRQEAEEIVKCAQGALSGIERGDLGSAERMLTEAQDRIGRLMREVGDQAQKEMLAPIPDERDRE